MSRSGVYYDKGDVILKPSSTGKIHGEGFFDVFKLKQHNLYTGSELIYVSGAVSTTDNTTTAILSIPVASGDSIHGYFIVGGKQDDESDATSALVVAAATNAAGTTAVKGTQSVTVVESAASTNVTCTADDTNDKLLVNVVGITAENWDWTAHGFYFYVRAAT